MVGQNVLLPTEATQQIPLDSDGFRRHRHSEHTATFNDRAMDDNDEPWATEADHRTGWNRTLWNCSA